MSGYRLDNIFSQDELILLDSIVSTSTEKYPDPVLGRDKIDIHNIPGDITNKINSIVKDITGQDLVLGGYSAAEYNNKYANPNLPPHFDGDNNDVIFNFQVSSNTTWGIGVDLDLYELEDNSALVFYPNENAHWRTHKTFEDGQYVRMIFIRFYNRSGRSDYSHKAYQSTHPIFDDVNAFRNQL